MISRGGNSVREWRGLRGRLWKRMTGKAETPCPPRAQTQRARRIFPLAQTRHRRWGAPLATDGAWGDELLGAGLSKFHVMIVSGRGPPFNLRGSFPFLPAQRPQSFLMLAL